jgi:hypothetical protein
LGGIACSNALGNLIDGGGNISSDPSPAMTDPTSHNNVNPLVGTLGYYGGPTPTIPLLPGSPAIDAANAAGCLPTDQRGYPRPYGAGCDIGAFEFWPSNSVFGRISGYVALPAGMTVSAGAVSTSVRPDGTFGLGGLPNGASVVTPNCADAVFVPSSLAVTLPPDTMGVDFYAYRSNALVVVTGPPNTLTIRQAGPPGTRYRLLVSTDFQTWVPCATNTATANGLADFVQTNPPTSKASYFRAMKF